jgi:medium-chain acyl-[acyl-carrier-protein] hydrolase
MAHLVSEAVDSLQQEQALDIEFVLFGHSLGGKVAFEIARELRRRRMRGPSLLIVSGARAPHIAEADLHFRELPDAEFLRSLNGKVGGLPEGILDNHELRQFLLPTLRADLEVLDTYLHEPEPPLDCPISCFGGSRDDRVPIESLAAWMDHTTGHFRLRTFQGGHFFLQERPDAFREALLSELREVVGAG